MYKNNIPEEDIKILLQGGEIQYRGEMHTKETILNVF